MWIIKATFRFSLLVATLLILFSVYGSKADALTVGPIVVSSPLITGCSRLCESSYCYVAPLLKYGKYCGIGYSGCPGEKPCDGLDACCQAHDSCVQHNDSDYLNVGCNKGLLSCIEKLRETNAPTFQGNSCNMQQVTELITHVIELAVVAGEALEPHP